jgi:hypothetical protein
MSLVPLLEVTWPMFFLGDQLCSHSRLLNDFFVFSCVSITNPSYSNISQYFAPLKGESITFQQSFCFRVHDCPFFLKMFPDVADTRTCFNLGDKTAIRICSGCLPLVIRCVLLMIKSLMNRVCLCLHTRHIAVAFGRDGGYQVGAADAPLR